MTGAPKNPIPKPQKTKKDKRPRNKILLNINEAPSFSSNKLLKYWNLQSTLRTRGWNLPLHLSQSCINYIPGSSRIPPGRPITPFQWHRKVRIGIIPQPHWSHRMSPKPGTRCWRDTRPHPWTWSCHPWLQGELLVQARARGRNEAHQTFLGEALERLCLPDNHKWFQGIFHGIGTGRSRQLPKALWGGTVPPMWPRRSLSHQESWDPSFPKNPGGSSTAPSTRGGGLPDTSNGLLVSLVWTSCKFLINIWILPVQSHLIEHKVITKCPHKPPPGHWVSWRTQRIPILGRDHGKETLFDVKATLHKFLQNSPSSHTAKSESKPPIITKKHLHLKNCSPQEAQSEFEMYQD